MWLAFTAEKIQIVYPTLMKSEVIKKKVPKKKPVCLNDQLLMLISWSVRNKLRHLRQDSWSQMVQAMAVMKLKAISGL